MRALIAAALLGAQGCVTRRYCDGQTAALGRQCIETMDQLGSKCVKTASDALEAVESCLGELRLCRAAKGVWGAPQP